MNAPLLEIQPEQLSARDISTLLKLTPRAVRLRMERLDIEPMLREGTRVWSLNELPADYQHQLQFVKKRSGLWTFEDLLRTATQIWMPDFKLSTLPEYSQNKAYKVKAVMKVYFEKFNDDESLAHEANCAARHQWLLEFAEACSEKTIRNWVKKTEERGGVQWACIEAYADRKATPHLNARLENRAKLRVPPELIRAFKALCVQPDMNIAAAFRKLELDWQVGREVPGVGGMTEPRQPFPFKVTQLRKFAPSMGARKLGNRGNAEARRDSLPHITRTYEQLRACEMFVMDDTRINVTAFNDLNGNAVELKCYIAMEVASRRIVGYVIREGNMRASDVDALIARVLRTCGIAHPNAGYATLVQLERGTVACSPQKKVFIESMFPGRVRIKQTSMDGGQNHPGDYVQAASGHWMGKGVIESFMRTLGYITRHIAGQRGSERTKVPTMVGYPNELHAGSQMAEAAKLIQAARSAAYLKSNGVDAAPHAREAVDALGVKLPALFVSQFRQAFALSIMAYNDEQEHRREGFRQIEVETEKGLRYRDESSNERWAWLNWTAEQLGKAPQRIAPADAVMLLHKARQVTVTKQGAIVTVEGKPYRYWHPDSVACAEATKNTTLKKEFIAVCDPDDLSEIYLLRNIASTYQNGDAPQFLECLPLYKKAGANNAEELLEAAEDKRRVHNRAAHELAEASEPFLETRTEERASNLSRMDGVIATTNGDCRVTSDMSAVGRAMRLARANSDRPKSANGRDHQASTESVNKLAALIAKHGSEEP